jgi:hypothetical protein
MLTLTMFFEKIIYVYLTKAVGIEITPFDNSGSIFLKRIIFFKKYFFPNFFNL